MKLQIFVLLAVGFLLAGPASPETLEIPGLSEPATVHTDDLGVAHITAATFGDAVRVQGWVVARDRFFQMDRSRRASNGTLAELTGHVLDLQQDGLAKLVDIPGAARRSLELMTPEVRALYQAYADGVNAWLTTHPLPDEYAELEVSRVAPWTVLDTVSGLKGGWALIDLRLYEIFDTDQLAEYVAAGPGCSVDGRSLFLDAAARFAPFIPVATVPDAAVASVASGATARSAGGLARLPVGAGLARSLRGRSAGLPGIALRKQEPPRGSNAWGVAASKTADGAPLLASDGHFNPKLPSEIYPIQLVVEADPVLGALNLSGAHFPGGLPGVDYVGQNQNLVWGGTAFFPDAMDFYADRLVRGDPSCPARLCIDSAGALHPVEEIAATYRINVLDGIFDNTSDATQGVAGLLPEAVRILRVPFRSFGPIYALDDPSVVDDGGTSPAETEVVTIQYSGLHGTRDHAAHIDMMTATNVDEFVAAVRRFSQNRLQYVVADRSGGLAYVAGGDLPLRADLEAGSVHDDGMQFVRDGSGPANWVPDPARSQGQDIPFAVIPDEDMPEIVNPPAGFVVTANNDPLEDTLDNDLYNQPRPSAPGTIRYVGASQWSGLRAASATDLLREKIDASEPLTRDDMRRIQTDGTPYDATLFVPFLLTAWTNAQDAGAPPELAAFAGDAELVEALDRIGAWDFTAPTGIPEGYDASSYTADADGVRSDPVPAAEIAASIANTIYQVWRAELIDDVVIAGFARCGLQENFQTGSTNTLLQLLSAEPFTGAHASGLDFFPEPGALAAGERRDVALLQSLRDTLDLLASNTFASAFGNSTSQDDYRWGRLHRIVFPHVLGGDRSLPPAAGFEDVDAGLPGLARDGAYGAINRTGSFFSWFRAKRPADFLSDGSAHIAQLRWVAEAVDGAGDGLWATSSLGGGASEDVSSPLYASRFARWLTGDYDDVLVTPIQIAALPSEDALAAEVSKAQQVCIQELNKRGAAVGKSQAKEASSCVKLAAKGKDADPQTCLTADAKGKVAKARAKAASGEEKKCSERPLFAYGGEGAAADAGAAASLALVQDVLGTDLNEAIVTKSGDKAGAACQAELLKGAQKALETAWKEAGKAKQAALAGKKGAVPAESGSDVQDALAAVFAPSAKLEKALGKLASGGAKKCSGVADLAAIAPGTCADGDAANVTACLRARVLCRACRSLNAMDALALPCDTLDDGDVNESC